MEAVPWPAYLQWFEFGGICEPLIAGGLIVRPSGNTCQSGIISTSSPVGCVAGFLATAVLRGYIHPDHRRRRVAAPPALAATVSGMPSGMFSANPFQSNPSSESCGRPGHNRHRAGMTSGSPSPELFCWLSPRQRELG